uniref:Uncharacterized protein n=1 Tax=Tetraselmis sp. GSL018 TaxID=582737 RepID=A0A061SDX4_9CHLO
MRLSAQEQTRCVCGRPLTLLRINPQTRECSNRPGVFPGKYETVSRRTVFLPGICSLAFATFLPRDAKASEPNTEILRALERRKQALEPVRQGTRTLNDLSTELAKLSDELRDSLQVVQKHDLSTWSEKKESLKGTIGDCNGVADELAVLLRCVRPTFDRFEGLSFKGTCEKLYYSLGRDDTDWDQLEDDIISVQRALKEVMLVASTALQDPRQLWSFCFPD